MEGYVTSDLAVLEGAVKSYLKDPYLSLAFDIETTGLNPRIESIVTLQFARRGKKSALIFDMRPHYNPESIPRLREILEPLWQSNVTLLGHNLKFDLGFMLVRLGLYARCNVYDTLVAEQMITGLGMSRASKNKISFSMEAVAERYGLSISKQERSWFIDLDMREGDWSGPFPVDQVAYMAQDVSILFEIQDKQKPLIEKYELDYVLSIENKAILGIVDIETNGIAVDKEKWLELIKETEEKALGFESDLHAHMDEHVIKARVEKYEQEYAVWKEWEERRDSNLINMKQVWQDSLSQTDVKWGLYKKEHTTEWNALNPQPKKPVRNVSPVNLGSPDQLKIAFKGLEIPADCARKEVLELLEDTYPVVHAFSQWKVLNTLVTSFGVKKMDLVEGGRIYPSYHQNGADTGRMSCFGPNLQQIPGRGAGKKLRNFVVAPVGWKMIVADFSNIELRILAEASQDPNMLRFFREGVDLHSKTAIQMFNLEVPDHSWLEIMLLKDPKLAKDCAGLEDYDILARTEAVMSGRPLGTSWRSIAKTINFGLLYGMGPAKLSLKLRISLDDAKTIMAKYFELYAGVKVWIDAQKARVDRFVLAKRARCFSKTMSGRRRWYGMPLKPNTISKLATIEELEAYKEAENEYKKDLASVKRACVNSPIQGTSADITKYALWLIHERNANPLNTMLVGVVHDEIILQARDGYVDEAAKLLSSCMDEAQKVFLQTVTVPAPKAVISDHWEH